MFELEVFPNSYISIQSQQYDRLPAKKSARGIKWYQSDYNLFNMRLFVLALRSLFLGIYVGHE